MFLRRNVRIHFFQLFFFFFDFSCSRQFFFLFFWAVAISTLAGGRSCNNQDSPAGLNGASEGVKDVQVNPTDSNEIIFVDSYDKRIRRLDRSANKTTTLAGTGQTDVLDGSASQAMFKDLPAILVDFGKNIVYIAEQTCIRMLSIDDNTVSTIAGDCWSGGSDDGDLDQATFMSITSLRFLTSDGSNNMIIVTDMGLHKIRMLDLSSNPRK